MGDGVAEEELERGGGWECMCVKEREYGMGQGEDKVAQERVGDGRESR